MLINVIMFAVKQISAEKLKQLHRKVHSMFIFAVTVINFITRKLSAASFAEMCRSWRLLDDDWTDVMDF